MTFLQSLPHRQADIVRAALHIADSAGLQSITTRKIAQVLGLTEGALYRHIRSKTDIFRLVLHLAHDLLKSQIASIEQSTPSSRERLLALLSYILDFLAEYPGIFRILFSDELYLRHAPLYPEFRAFSLDLLHTIQSWLNAGIQNRELPPHIDVETTALIFLGLVETAFSAWNLIDERKQPLKKRAQPMIELFMAHLFHQSTPKGGDR